MLSAEQLTHRYTLEEYLNCTDISHDSLYELENGKIVSMPPESWQNLQIIMYLITEITKVVPYQQVTNKAEIIISGSRVTARVPDLTVLTPEGAAELAQYKRSTIILDMPPPLLVVEVVSPGKRNSPKGLASASDRDYRFKRCSAHMRHRRAQGALVFRERECALVSKADTGGKATAKTMGQMPRLAQTALFGLGAKPRAFVGGFPHERHSPYRGKVPKGRWRIRAVQEKIGICS